MSVVTYTSVVSSPTPSTFTEVGTISADSAGAFNFTSTGSGGVVQSVPQATFGSIQYTIGGGAGRLAGFVGSMVDFFVAQADSTGAFDIATLGWMCDDSS